MDEVSSSSAAAVNVRLPNLEHDPDLSVTSKNPCKYQAMPVKARIEQKVGNREAFGFAILSASRAVASMPQ
jgi:hypothetical protein